MVFRIVHVVHPRQDKSPRQRPCEISLYEHHYSVRIHICYMFTCIRLRNILMRPHHDNILSRLSVKLRKKHARTHFPEKCTNPLRIMSTYRNNNNYDYCLSKHRILVHFNERIDTTPPRAGSNDVRTYIIYAIVQYVA